MNTITVPVLRIGVANKNKRIYPKETVQKMVVKSFGKKYMCEINAPDDPAAVSVFSVNMERVSHVVEQIFIQDEILYAELRVLKTPMGLVLQNLIDANATLQDTITAQEFVEHDGYAFRTSGRGTLTEQDDGTILVSDWTMTGVHYVANPA